MGGEIGEIGEGRGRDERGGREGRGAYTSTFSLTTIGSSTKYSPSIRNVLPTFPPTGK